MNDKTNVYILVDTSFHAKSGVIGGTLAQMARSLEFCERKNELFIIGYNDKGYLLSPYRHVVTKGNPNLAEGLSFLDTTLRYNRKYRPTNTRSVFLLYSTGNVLQGWNEKLNKLYQNKEFALGLRYAVAPYTDKYAQTALQRFTENENRILPYFSAGRLCSLVRNLR